MLISYSNPNLLTHDGKMIIPGINNVDQTWWLFTRKHPTIKHLIETGVITEMTDLADAITETPESEKDMDESFLKNTKMPAAKTVVAECTDVKLLKVWLKNEPRPLVKTLIEAQIKLMGEKLPKLDKSELGAKRSEGVEVQTVELDAKPSAIDD